MRLALLTIVQAGLFVSALSVLIDNQTVPLVTNFTEFDMRAQYRYVGCYERMATALANLTIRANMSRARCYMYCMDHGNLFFGMHGDSCHCGNSYGAVESLPESDCNITCSLDRSEKCGGSRALSVYVIIEKFSPMGCFAELYFFDSYYKLMGTNFTKIACALTCKRDALSPFFGMRRQHECVCIYNMDAFEKKTDTECNGTCLEPLITGCGNSSFASVYKIDYAESTAKVLNSLINFINEDRQIIFTAKSITLIGAATNTSSKLLIKVYSEDLPGSGNFNELIGATPSSEATGCPNGWLSWTLKSSATGGDGRRRSILAGPRCYLQISRPGLNWTEALQQCWRLDSDLFYAEDESEMNFLSTAGIGMAPHWIGMHRTAGIGAYSWTVDTTGPAGSKRRWLPDLADKGCVQLKPDNQVWTSYGCEQRIGYICKRFSTLDSSWDYQLPKPTKANHRLKLALHQIVSGSVDPNPVMTFNLSVLIGNYTVQIPSYPGSRFLYSAIERVPMKLCRPEPEGAAAYYYRCYQPGNARPVRLFQKDTCPTESYISRGVGSWLQPLTNWLSDVKFYVTEVHLNNPLNMSLRVESNYRTPCSRVGAFDGTWVKFECNSLMKGMIVTAADSKYPYMHMCDLQVFGKFISDSTPLRPSTEFEPGDRILDLKVRGLFQYRDQPNGPTMTRIQTQLADDLYVRIYYENKLIHVLHHRHSDKFSLPLKMSQSLRRMVLFTTARNHYTSDEIPGYRCSARLEMGTIPCHMHGRIYLLFDVKERVNLISCSQSSRLLPMDYCKNALDFAHSESQQLGRCAQTTVSDRPWWKAKVQSTFIFEEVSLYSKRDCRQWTRHFSLAIEITVCVSVVNGTAFDNKTFVCNLPGTEITVTALSRQVSLTLCELVAYGKPGGCGDVTAKTPGDRCSARLRSHLNYGSEPYTMGMRCQWVISTSSIHTVLLTFPEFRTASNKDYVAVYEGNGTSGKLLKRFYGSDENRPKYPWMTVNGLSNFVKGRSNHITIVFVTDRHSSAERTVQTHKGFVAEMHLVMLEDPSYLLGNEGPVCNEDLYGTYLASFCRHRNGIHPAVRHGYTIGMRMYRELERNLRRQQNRSLDDVDDSPWSVPPFRPSSGQTLLRQKRDSRQSLLRELHCNADRSSLSRWMLKCCCSLCNRFSFIRQCLHPYETVPAPACHIDARRLPYAVAEN